MVMFRDERDFLVVSWNIHRCIGVDRVYSPQRVAEVLSALEPDLIALQEVDSSLKVASGQDQLTFISEKLQMYSVMGPTLHRDYGAYGNAILSRFEFNECEEHSLTYGGYEPRGALAVNIDLGPRMIRLVNVHLGLRYFERSFQINRLVSDIIWNSAVWRSNIPVLLAGDFNEWIPFSGNNLKLKREFLSVPKLATFHATWPRLSLDRIYPSQIVEIKGYDVLSGTAMRQASDHLPLMLRCRFLDLNKNIEI